MGKSKRLSCSCGYKLTSELNYCPGCGKPIGHNDLQADAEHNKESLKYCTGCGEQRRALANFCFNCGKQFSQTGE